MKTDNVAYDDLSNSIDRWWTGVSLQTGTIEADLHETLTWDKDIKSETDTLKKTTKLSVGCNGRPLTTSHHWYTAPSSILLCNTKEPPNNVPHPPNVNRQLFVIQVQCTDRWYKVSNSSTHNHRCASYAGINHVILEVSVHMVLFYGHLERKFKLSFRLLLELQNMSLFFRNLDVHIYFIQKMGKTLYFWHG